MLAQKMDVAEELDRLDAHIEEARATLATEGAVGRKLDFLMQEFNREANTLGSKSADAETTKAAAKKAAAFFLPGGDENGPFRARNRGARRRTLDDLELHHRRGTNADGQLRQLDPLDDGPLG